MQEPSDPKTTFIDIVLRIVAIIGILGLAYAAFAIFGVGGTLMVSVVLAYITAKIRPAAPLYVAIGSLPLLIGLSFIAKGGNAWDTLIQQVAAFVMFMILFGGYSLFANWIRTMFVAEVSGKQSQEVLPEPNEDEYDEPIEQPALPAIKTPPSAAKPQKKPRKQEKRPKIKINTPHSTITHEANDSAHFVDLRKKLIAERKKTAAKPVRVTDLRSKASPPKPEKPVHLTTLKAKPAKKPKPVHVTDLRDGGQTATRRKPTRRVSG